MRGLCLNMYTRSRSDERIGPCWPSCVFVWQYVIEMLHTIIRILYSQDRKRRIQEVLENLRKSKKKKIAMPQQKGVKVKVLTWRHVFSPKILEYSNAHHLSVRTCVHR